jgi:hypothetical protein
VYATSLQSRPLPFEAQYWNGSSFVRNNDDSLTSIARANIGLGNYAPSGFSGSFSLTNLPSGPFTVIGGAGTILLSPPTGSTTSGSVSMVFDLGNTTTPATSWTPATGQTPTAGAVLPYLRSRWETGTFDRDPTARITFGIAGGRGPVYRRETY